MNKEITKKLSPGHTTCAGCAIPLVIRNVLNATDDPIVVANATGCMEVTTTIYPNTSWKVPYIHSVFANAGATIAGVESAYRALKRKGKIKEKEVKFVAFGGDGGTYDIGLQSLSGALERRHDFLYVCYDNEAYMNTGNQRSGATPIGADTETTPTGKYSIGKSIPRKDLMSIVAGHHIAYAATANIGFLNDFKAKIKKAFQIKGPKFLLVFSPCTTLWKFPPHQMIKIAKLATETNFWPLYEIDRKGRYKINYRSSSPKPVKDFYRLQGRFKHLFKKKNKEEIFEAIQAQVDENWQRLVRQARMP
jgi:pyruvate ferredoxin oxidoreductase beta subunit